MKATCYHTRDYHKGTKASGGSISAGEGVSLDVAADRIASQFSVRVLPSGTPVFVDKHNREVWLYLTVNPAETTHGKLAIKVEQDARMARAEEERKQMAAQAELLENLLDDVGRDAAIRILQEHVAKLQ